MRVYLCNKSFICLSFCIRMSLRAIMKNKYRVSYWNLLGFWWHVLWNKFHWLLNLSPWSFGSIWQGLHGHFCFHVTAPCLVTLWALPEQSFVKVRSYIYFLLFLATIAINTKRTYPQIHTGSVIMTTHRNTLGLPKGVPWLYYRKQFSIST